MLIVDSREPKELQRRLAIAMPIVVQALTSADYVLHDTDGHCLAIERKRGGDLLSALSRRMKNGNVRLVDQLDRMQANPDYTHCALLQEGDMVLDEATMKVMGSGWNYGAIQMILWGLHGRGIYRFNTHGHSETVNLLWHLNRRATTNCVLPKEYAQNQN